MKYQQHLVIIPTDDGTENVTATIAQSVGLGYVQNGTRSYVVIATNLGNKGVLENCECRDERHAQLFIEELRKIIDWTQSGEVIMSAIATKHAFADGGIERRIQKAFDDAKAKHAKEVAA